MKNQAAITVETLRTLERLRQHPMLSNVLKEREEVSERLSALERDINSAKQEFSVLHRSAMQEGAETPAHKSLMATQKTRISTLEAQQRKVQVQAREMQ